MTFDWSKKIVISSGDQEADYGWSPEQRAIITKAIDAIAASHEKEGEMLIRSAAKARPITVGNCEHTAIETSSKETRLCLNLTEIAGLNYTDAKEIAVADGVVAAATLRNAPLNHMLATMLYQVANPLSRASTLRALTKEPLETLLLQQGLGNKKDVLERFIGFAGKDVPELPYQLLAGTIGGVGSKSGSDAEQMMAIWRKNGHGEFADLLTQIDTYAVKDILVSAGILTADGGLQSEWDAVRLADALSEKNNGSGAPQRRRIENIIPTAEPAGTMPKVLFPLPTAQPTNGFRTEVKIPGVAPQVLEVKPWKGPASAPGFAPADVTEQPPVQQTTFLQRPAFVRSA